MVIAPKTGKIAPTTESIEINAKFKSYDDFARVFERWKESNGYMFRIASSEKLKDKGKLGEVFQYRYVVFHCIHYGAPRIRGFGNRNRQNYLPCGCRAHLRLTYVANEKAMVITKLNQKHTGHGYGQQNPLDAQDADVERARNIARSAHQLAVARRALIINGKVEGPQTSKLKCPPFDEKYYQQKKYVEHLEETKKEMLRRLHVQRTTKGDTGELSFPPLTAKTLNYFFELEEKDEEERRSWAAEHESTDSD